MTHEHERLILVTDFSSLRQGDLVVVHCERPGCGKHRGLLMRMAHGNLGNRWDGVEFWETTASCGPVLMGLHAECVARRIVFLVDVGLSREAETHEAKPVTKPRELARGTR